MSNTTATKQRPAAKKQATTSTSSFKRFAPMLILLGVVFSFVTFCDKDDAPTATVTTATKATTTPEKNMTPATTKAHTTASTTKQPGSSNVLRGPRQVNTIREIYALKYDSGDSYVQNLGKAELIAMIESLNECADNDFECKILLGELLLRLIKAKYGDYPITRLVPNFYVLACYHLVDGSSEIRILPSGVYPDGVGNIYQWPDGMWDRDANSEDQIPGMDGAESHTWGIFIDGQFVDFNPGADADDKQYIREWLKENKLIQ